MIRRPGVVLAISFTIMVVLVIIMVATKQDNEGWGPLRLITTVVAATTVVSGVVFGMSPIKWGKAKSVKRHER
jgi:hypothetical protein